MQPTSIGCYTIGDIGVGKTCLLYTYFSSAFPEWGPTFFGTYTCDIIRDGGQHIKLGLYDTPGGDSDILRQMAYVNADVILLCFSVDSPRSLQHVLDSWVPELSLYSPNSPIILCCTKIDLRKDAEKRKIVEHKGDRIISTEEGITMAKIIGASAYIECSSVSTFGLKSVFDTAMDLGLNPSEARKRKKKTPSPLSKIILKFKSSFVRPPKKVLPGEVQLEFAPMSPIVNQVYGHSTVVVGEKIFVKGQKTIVIGGSNENGTFNTSLQIYRNSIDAWEVPRGIEMPPLQFHTCVSYGLYVYIFGGKSNGYRNDCYKLDTEYNSITKIEHKGSVPSPRYGHSAVVFDDKMYIFGGYDNQAMPCNDLYFLNIGTNEWEKVAVQGPLPPSRFMHTAIVNYKSMYIFGGKDGGSGDNATTFNDVHRFDFDRSSWTKVKTKGKSIAPRYGHAAVATVDGMYVMGGCDKSNNNFFSDFFFFDVHLSEWFSPSVIGDSEINFISRFHHSCVFDHVSNSILTIGGTDSTGAPSSAFILTIIKSYLVMNLISFRDFLSLKCTSKLMYHSCEEERLWKLFYSKLFRHNKTEVTSYKEFLYENFINRNLIVQSCKS